MEEHELQLGANREFNWGTIGNVVFGARYIHKDLKRTIEDVGVTVPGVGTQYYMANPGEGITLTLNDPSIPPFPKAKRTYDGLELTDGAPVRGQLGPVRQLHVQPPLR